MINADEVRFLKLLRVVDMINDNLERLNESFITLNNRISDLEVKLDNLRVQYKSHDHPYKPEPRYG